MRLLVTGGAGYIGSVVTAQLLADGHEVVVLDDLSRGHAEAIPAGATHANVNLLDRDAVDGTLGRGFDGAMHFAALALVGESVKFPERYWTNNLLGTRNLLDAMRAHGVGRLVFSSTCAVYGEPESIPMDETTPTAPVNAYGASKLAADMMITDECRAHGLAATSLRYFNVAGASGDIGEDHEPETHVIPNVLRAALGLQTMSIFGTDYDTPDGTAVRDYIHVEDLGHAHKLAIDASPPGEHRIYNLGNGEGFSVRQVVDACAQVTGRDIPVEEGPRRPGDPPTLVASAARVRADLGWTPSKPDIATMIADAWAWYQAHPDGYAGAGAR
jgi:UDP-glucose 4-epimerase